GPRRRLNGATGAPQRGLAGLPSRQGVRDWSARRRAVPGSPHATSNSRRPPRRGLLPRGGSQKPSVACPRPSRLPVTPLFLMPSSVSSAGGAKEPHAKAQRAQRKYINLYFFHFLPIFALFA